MGKNYDKILAYRENKNEERQGLSSSNYSKILQYRLNNAYESTNKAINESLSGWQDADTMASNKLKAEKYYNDLKSLYGKTPTKEQSENLKAYESILGEFDERSKIYSNYLNPDAFNKDMKTYELGQKYKGASYEDIQKALKSAADIDEISFLRNYTDYSSLEDFDKAIADRASIREETQKGHKGKVKDVQEDKLRNAKDIYEKTHAFDDYRYLMDQEDYAEKSKDDTALRAYESGTATDPIRMMARGNIAFSDSLSDEQREMATYLFNRSEDEYLDYMKKMTYVARMNEAEDISKDLTAYAEEHPVASSVTNAISSPIYGFIGGVEQLGSIARESTDPTTLAQLTQGMAEANSVVSQNIKNEYGELPSFAYDLFTTTVPNRIGEMLYGKGYTAVMGLSSFASTYAQEIKEGANPTDALKKAFASGAIETLTELIPWEQAFSKGKKWYTKMAKQMFYEGSEEFIGALADLAYDSLANNGYNEIQEKIQKYVEMGYDSKEAYHMAHKDYAVELLRQFALGALAVAPTTGVQVVTQSVQESRMGEYIDREKLAEVGSEELLKKYGEEWSQKASNREIYNAYDKYVTETKTKATETEKADSVKALMSEYNLSEEEATKYVEALYEGKNRKILNTHFGSVIKEEADNGTGWASKVNTEESSKYVDKLSKAADLVMSKDQVQANKAQKKLKVAEKNTVNGEEADIISMKANKDGSYTVKTSKGEVDSKEVTVTENKAKALSYSADIQNETLKEAFVHYYQGEDIYDYDQYVRTAYEAGIESLDLSEFTSVIDGLGKAKAMAFYNLGAEKTLREELATEEALDKVTKAIKSTGKFESGAFVDGKFKKDDNIFRNLNRTQKKLYKVVEAFSKLSGINTRIFVDRSAASKNGEFVSGTDGGWISINLAARPYGDSMYGINRYVVSTLSHELTHWLKANNEEAYNILENAIVESLTEKGTLENAIKKEQDNYKKTEGEELSREVALEEVVARACENMLNNTETMAEVLSHTDMNGLERLKAAFEEWFKHIKEFFDELMSGFSSPNEITQSLSEEYEELRKIWIKGINDAINMKRSGQQSSKEKVASTKETRNSLPQSVLNTLSTEDKKNYQAFSSVVDSYLAGTHPTREHLRIMEHTPTLLQQIGLGDKEIYMTKQHFRNITHPEDGIHSQYHGLSKTEVKEAPILLNNPAIIADSMTDSSSVIVISMSPDYKGRPIILTLKTDGEGQGIQLVDSNFMTSMYGRNNFTNWMSTLIQKGNVLYISQKNSQMLKGFGIQFPAGFNALGFNKIIHQSQNAVKSNHLNSLKLSEKEEKALDTLNVEIEGSYAYPKFNLKTFRESDYNKNIDVAAATLAKTMEISVEEAKKYIKDVGSIANIIARDRDRLDYAAIEGKSAWVSNPEYGGSLDYSFLCPKRLTYTGTMNAILRKQNDLIFSVDDFLWLRKALITAGYEAPCSYCFVESARARFGKYNKQFLDIAKEEKLAYIPTAEDLTNPDKLEEMRENHPETYRRYEKFLNSLSQRKPKMLEERRAYDGDILKAFLGKEDTIKDKNLHGGIRFNSFSDFEIVHMLDCMQAIMDMSRVGLAGFGYTKQKAFVEIFGNTGLKINMSCMAKGVEADGKHVIFDDIEGMNHNDALKLRNGNVGIVCVVFNDVQLRAALCDERIDYVLPFHRSQWSKADYEKMGLSLDTKDYTRPQTEKLGTKKAKEGNIPFLSYWNANQTGTETVQRYLDIINEQGKTPIFPVVLEKVDGKWVMPKGIKKNGKFINKTEEIKEKAAENYWKLLTEAKMYNNDGTPIGQTAVTPNFNMKAARELLKKYDGSHKEFPVAQNVVDDFLEYKKTGETKNFEWKRSSNKMDSDGKALTEDQAKFFKNSKARDDLGRLLKFYHGTDKNAFFTVFDNQYSDDGLSFFFTSKKEVAESYSGNLLTDLNERMWAENDTINWEEIFVEDKKDGKVKYMKTYKTVKEFDNAYEAAKWWCEENGIPIDVFAHDEKRDLFEVYLNAKNPLIIDAQGEYWDSIDWTPDGAAEMFDIRQRINAYEKKERNEVKTTKAEDIQYNKDVEEYEKMEKEINQFGDISTTRGIAKYAKAHGYDSVIINNVVDVGGKNIFANETESTVCIMFDPSSIKLTTNEHPTNDKDIRYSNKIDSKGSSLTEAQAKYFENSKLRDKNGNLIVMYHGTFNDFTVFDMEKANEDSWRGAGFYFTSSEDEAKQTYASLEGGDSQNKLDMRASQILEEWGYTWEGDIEYPTEYTTHKLYGPNSWTKVPADKGKKLYDKAIAKAKKDFKSGKVMKVYLDIKNPYIIPENNTKNTWDITEEVYKGKHDGIIDYSVSKEFNLNKDVFHVTVFKPNQIKSVDNLNPTDNEDIRMSEKMSYDELSDEAKERIRELEEEVGRLSDENAALRAEKLMEKNKAEKKIMVDRITEQAKILSRWLLTNDKQNPVPQSVRIPLGKFLTSIDFTKDSYEWRKSHGLLSKSDESLGTRMSKISQMLLELDQDKSMDKDAYDMSQLDWIPEFSTEFAKIKDTIAEVESKEGERFHLGKMNHDDLQTLLNLITALKTSIINMNKCLSAHNKMTVEGVGKEVISYLDRIGQKDKDGFIKQFLEISNTTPYYFFQRLGNGGEHTFKLLMDGMSKYAFEAKQIEDFAKETFKGEDVKKWRDEVKTFEVEEYEIKTDKKEGEMPLERKLRTIQMTVPQIMSLYCLQKRDQAMNHIKTGGIRVGTFETREDGKKVKVRQVDNVTLTEKDLKNILSTLTEPQKEVADKLQKFMNTVCQKWGNEVTMKRFGYKGMTEKDYFPINVDRNQLSSEARQKGSSLYQMLNMGFTKPINPNAKNPIEIFDIFETFTIHATEMAQYNSLALPVLDVIKIWNYRDQELLDEEENKAHWHSVKGSIESVLGEKANGYIGRLLADLNGDVTGGRADKFGKKLVKNYKTAAVAANLQVAMLQPLSYVRAGYMVDNKYLTKGLAMKSDREKTLKYCGIAQWKEMGFYNTAINTGLEHKIMQDDSKKDKIIEKTLFLAGKMDEWTWGKLWNACLLETQDNYPTLEGKDLYKKTGERLTEVIYGTQVVDSILTRSDLMRGADMYTNMITAFQSEPTLSLNILMDAAVRFDQEKRASGAQAALKVHGDKIKRAAIVYLTSAVFESLLRAVIGKIRNYDGDEDDETLIEDFFKRFIEELNPLRKIPLVKDIVDILVSAISKGKIYTDTRLDEAVFENIGKSYLRIQRILSGGEVNYKAINEIAKGFDASGLPVSSTIRVFKVLWNNTIGRIWESLNIK